MVNYEVTDEETGDFQVRVVGHRFEAIQCVDGTGAPLPGGTDCEVTQRDFTNGCTTSGCHGSAEAARSAYTTAKTRIEGLVSDVQALLAQVPAGQLNAGDGIFTVADGANFNAQLAALPGSPIHNPFLIEQLLLASAAALEETYGLGGAPAIDMRHIDQHRELRVDGIGR